MPQKGRKYAPQKTISRKWTVIFNVENSFSFPQNPQSFPQSHQKSEIKQSFFVLIQFLSLKVGFFLWKFANQANFSSIGRRRVEVKSAGDAGRKLVRALCGYHRAVVSAERDGGQAESGGVSLTELGGTAAEMRICGNASG